MKLKAAILTLIAGLATVAYQGCSGVHENPGVVVDTSSLASGDVPGFLAFQSGFYQFTQTQNCAMCHGKFQTPKFADPDPMVAYSNFKGLVNPADPTGSIIITYAGNGHCQADPCSHPEVRPQVISDLQSWAAAVNSSSGGGGLTPSAKYLTDGKPLPATIPALGAAPAVLRYPLAGFAIPALSKAILELEVNQYSPGEYKVARLKIAGATAQVTISGVHVYVRSSTATGVGLEDPNQGMAWASLVAVVNPSTLPATLPTAPLNSVTFPVLSPDSLGIAAQSTADVLTVGIDDIQLGATAAPTVVHFTDLISSNAQLGIFTSRCVSCHDSTNAAGGLNLTNYTSAKNNAATIQLRINSSVSPMPPSGQIAVSERNVIDAWVTGGALQ